MSNSKEQYVHYHNSLTEINRRAREEPQSFAQDSEQAYQAELRRIAEQAARETAMTAARPKVAALCICFMVLLFLFEYFHSIIDRFDRNSI